MKGGKNVKELFSVRETAEIFDVHVNTAYKWVRTGLIKANRLPGEWIWRVPRSAINELREKMSLEPLPEDE